MPVERSEFPEFPAEALERRRRISATCLRPERLGRGFHQVCRSLKMPARGFPIFAVRPRDQRASLFQSGASLVNQARWIRRLHHF